MQNAWISLAVASALALVPAPVQAQGQEPRAQEPPDGAVAFFTGAVVLVGAFATGGLLLATSADSAQDNTGWLMMNAGFTLAPLASHGVSGEWTRGLAFAAAPGATTAATAVLFGVDSGAIVHGSLPEQRVLWSFFGIGLLSGAGGVIDSAFARERAGGLTLIPSITADRVGLQLAGTL